MSTKTYAVSSDGDLSSGPDPYIQQLPYLEGSEASEFKWREVEGDDAKDRTYHYPEGVNFSVDKVKWISISKKKDGHVHRLVTTEGKCYYITRGWIAISWSGKFEF